MRAAALLQRLPLVRIFPRVRGAARKNPVAVREVVTAGAIRIVPYAGITTFRVCTHALLATRVMSRLVGALAELHERLS